MSVEYATLGREIDHRSAAIRNAPAWVRRRLGAISPTPLAEGVPGFTILEHQPDGSLRHVSGPPVDLGYLSRPAGGSCIRWDPRSPHRPGALMTRVWCVVAHGDAAARSIGERRNETFTRAAFGAVDKLNKSIGWSLMLDHDGPVLARRGSQRGGIVAHDSEVGLVLSWSPDLDNRQHVEALDRIEKDGWGCSVRFSHDRSDVLTVPGQNLNVVYRARLIHVALVNKPAYRGAIAMVFRNSHREDKDEMREQLAKVVGQAKFAERRAKGWA